MKKRNIPLIALCSSLLVLSSIGQTSDSLRIPLLAEDETNVIFLNDKVTVEPRTLSYNDETKVVNGKIITPSGASLTGREFTAKEHGLYKVVYETYFGREAVNRTVNYLCKRKSMDYFSFNDVVEASYGEFRHNTSRFSHHGVVLDFRSGATINFNEPLDVNDFMEVQPIEPGKIYSDPSSGAVAKSLLDVIVDPANKMEMDFGGLLFRLTDAEDPNNYVEMRMQEPGYTDYLAGALSYVRVGASNNYLAGWEFGWTGSDGAYHPGHYHLSSSGTGIAMSFKAQAYQDYLHSGQILFDYGNKRFYSYPGSLSHEQVFFINDLDNPELYRTNIWDGFKGDKFYLSITPYAFTNPHGRLIVKSIGKYNFENEIIEDITAPRIEIDYQNNEPFNLPKALVGNRYSIFSSKVVDNYDSFLNAKVSVIYKDTVNGQDIDVNVSNNSFLASKSGTYYINYDATDRSGNSADRVSLKVETVDNISPVSLTYNGEPISSYVFKDVNIPSINDIVASGGSGYISLTRTIYDPDNNIVELNGNNLHLEDIGTYHVIFKGVDYLGNEGSLDISVNSLSLEKPEFVDNVNLPPVLIKGFTYKFDKVRTVESVNSENVFGESLIKVNGNDYQGSYTADGEEVTVEYIARGDTGETIESFIIPVINPYGEGGMLNEANYFYGDIAKQYNEDDITFTFNEEKTILFANKLDSSNLYVNLEQIDGKTNFKNIKFKLISASDSTRAMTFDLDVVNQKINVPVFGNLDFVFSGKEMIFQYQDNNMYLLDSLDNIIAQCVYDDNNDLFEGFKDGVYLSLTFSGVTSESQVKITKLNNHALGYKNNDGDVVGPTIRLDSEFLPVQYHDEEFFYPTFNAYDVFSEITTSQIRIITPSEEVLNRNADEFNSFIINEYGSYTVSYNAIDSFGNPTRRTYVSFVYDDVKPSLTVGELKNDKYHVGDIVKIPTYTANDNLGHVIVDVILIMPSNEMRILTHDDNGNITYALIDTTLYNSSFIVDKESFRLEMKGRYTLRYVAYDEGYNVTTVERVFNAY